MDKKLFYGLYIAILLILLIIVLSYHANPEKFVKKIVSQNTDVTIVPSGYQGDIIVKNSIMYSKILKGGEVGFAESYMDGDWETPDLEKTLYKLNIKKDQLEKAIKNQSISFIFSEIKVHLSNPGTNNLKSSEKNVEHHYDIGNDLYTKMLGPTMQYTCAYFYKPNMTLNEAQMAKMELIAKKLNLREGMRVLDIGCGFGSMGYHLAKKYGVRVTGVTLSGEQKDFADNYFRHPNLKIELKDYRNVNGKFDRVYSVGMFEHVGRKNHQEYYDKCYELLEDDGIMLLHTIGTTNRKWNHNSFINKYIFPGGELPILENLTKPFADKWYLEDFHNFGLSYSKTLRWWRKNLGNWEGMDNYSEKFRRMWDFYLYGCSTAFLSRGTQLWQFVYVKVKTHIPDNLHHIRN